MAVPLQKYVSIKDNYCIGYFGNDTQQVKKIIKARGLIEKTFPELQVFLVFTNDMKQVVKGKKNIILERNLANYQGKMAYYRILEEKEDIIELLRESNIPFSEDF